MATKKSTRTASAQGSRIAH